MANIPNFANPNYADDDVNMVMGIYNAIEDTLEMVRLLPILFLLYYVSVRLMCTSHKNSILP